MTEDDRLFEDTDDDRRERLYNSAKRDADKAREAVLKARKKLLDAETESQTRDQIAVDLIAALGEVTVELEDEPRPSEAPEAVEEPESGVAPQAPESATESEDSEAGEDPFEPEVLTPDDVEEAKAEEAGVAGPEPRHIPGDARADMFEAVLGGDKEAQGIHDGVTYVLSSADDNLFLELGGKIGTGFARNAAIGFFDPLPKGGISRDSTGRIFRASKAAWMRAAGVDEVQPDEEMEAEAFEPDLAEEMEADAVEPDL